MSEACPLVAGSVRLVRSADQSKALNQFEDPCIIISGSGMGIDFVSYQENIDTSSHLGGAIFTIISAVAQLERDMIAERVKAGLRRARKKGEKLGRPIWAS